MENKTPTLVLVEFLKYPSLPSQEAVWARSGLSALNYWKLASVPQVILVTECLIWLVTGPKTHNNPKQKQLQDVKDDNFLTSYTNWTNNLTSCAIKSIVVLLWRILPSCSLEGKARHSNVCQISVNHQLVLNLSQLVYLELNDELYGWKTSIYPPLNMYVYFPVCQLRSSVSSWLDHLTTQC